MLVFDHYTFDEVNRELRRGSEPVRADPQHLDLLELFLRHPGELLSRQQIIDAVWEGRAIADSVLSVSIAKLRKVLGKTTNERDFIESRYGRGYRFLPEVKWVRSPERPGGNALAAKDVASRAPLVGREDAFTQLTSAAERAQLGQGSLCILTGEPGIGKTRLAEALEQSVHERGQKLTTVWARCQPEASTPLWPVRQLMRELTKLGLTAAEETRVERSDETSSWEDTSRRLFGSLNCSNANVDHPLLDTLAQRVFSASQRQPLLILIDDIQWADSASLRLLTYLTDEITRYPILLACTLRGGKLAGDGQRELSRLCNHRNCHHIELSRLNATDVSAYVSALFEGDTSELSHMLFARSEGNPFFMVDLLRSVDRAQPAKSNPLKLSGLALEAVRLRLQDLPTRAQRALSAAAVIGHDFDIGLLSHVTDSRPEEVLDALTGSLENETVVASGEVAGVFGFDHELIREVLYAELPALERGQLHLRAGQGLLQRRATGGAVTNAELAHHFLAAQPHGDIEVAVAHAQAAATDASRMAAHSDVREILRRALDALRFWVAPRPEIRAALLLQLAMVERILGEPSYKSHLIMAVSLAREHRLGSLLTLAGQLLSPSPGLVAHAEAAHVLEAAREIVDPKDHKNQAIVCAHLAWTPPSCHSAREVKRLVDEAIACAELTDSPGARAAVKDARLFFSAGPDTLEQAEAIAREIDHDCITHPETAVQTRRMLVAGFRLITAMQRGDRVAVSRALEARAALLAQLNNVELRWHQERMLLVQRLNEGDFANIKTDLIALRERASKLALFASQLLWGLDYGVLIWRTEDVSELAARVRPGMKPSAHDAPATRGRKIRSMVDFGLVEDVAAAMAQVSLDAIDDLPHDREYLSILCQLAVGAAAAGSRAHCEVLYRKLAAYGDYYAVGVSFHCDGSVATHLGLLSEALGMTERAREHYAYGLERERAFGLRPCAAQTAFRLGTLLLRDSSERAKALLERAQGEAERMGMRPLARAAREALDTAICGEFAARAASSLSNDS